MGLRGCRWWVGRWVLVKEVGSWPTEFWMVARRTFPLNLLSIIKRREIGFLLNDRGGGTGTEDDEVLKYLRILEK